MQALGSRVAFSLAEFILALALAVIGLLSLVAISLAALKSNRKATDTSVGFLLAEQTAEQIVYGMQCNTSAPIWSHTLPAEYSTDSVSVSNQSFSIVVYARDPIGGLSTPNRLKRIEVVTRWWDAGSGGNRAGMGRLEARTVRIVREP